MNVDFSTIDSTVTYINSFGLYGPIVAFILFFIQAVAPVIPYMIFAGAVGMIYGNMIGFILAWTGALAGAVFLFLISRRLGSNIFIRRVQEKYNFDISSIDEKYIFWVLLLCRIFPVVPTPIINIGSGLAGVSFRVFAFSSGIGKIPWAILYVALGNYFMDSKNILNTVLMIGAIIVFSFVGIYCFRRKLPYYRKDDG